MRLIDYLDKGASLDGDAPCLTTDGDSLSYDEVRTLASRVARALAASGIGPGDKVAILSANDPVAFTCVFGISEAGAIWSPINPRNEASENRDLLDFFDCSALIYQGAFESLVEKILPDLPQLTSVVCLDGATESGVAFAQWLDAGDAVLAPQGIPKAVDSGQPGIREPASAAPPGIPKPADDVAMIVGTGGTTGRPKGVMLTTRNLETMTSIVLMSYPFSGRPVYLALAPLTHAAGVLCFPVLAKGGEIVIMRKPDVHDFVALIEQHHITHTFLPPTLIYMVLGLDDFDGRDLSSLECFWYGAAPMSAARLEEALVRIGPVMAQLFGQTEAPMMISTMAPADHYLADGSLALARLSSAGRAAPLVTVAVMDDDGVLLDAGGHGEIVIRSSLVMAGYYKNAAATEEVGRFGWHHTGDIGYLDENGYLYIVDRAKDVIITGGFNVYSAQVEQVLMQFPSVRDCAVVGLPDEKWGERVTAVVQCDDVGALDREELRLFVKERLGSVKTPKQIEVWNDLPRSKLGKVLKADIKLLLAAG